MGFISAVLIETPGWQCTMHKYRYRYR